MVIPMRRVCLLGIDICEFGNRVSEERLFCFLLSNQYLSHSLPASPPLPLPFDLPGDIPMNHYPRFHVH